VSACELCSVPRWFAYSPPGGADSGVETGSVVRLWIQTKHFGAVNAGKSYCICVVSSLVFVIDAVIFVFSTAYRLYSVEPNNNDRQR
jgi:hypothetical protein